MSATPRDTIARVLAAQGIPVTPAVLARPDVGAAMAAQAALDAALEARTQDPAPLRAALQVALWGDGRGVEGCLPALRGDLGLGPARAVPWWQTMRVPPAPKAAPLLVEP